MSKPFWITPAGYTVFEDESEVLDKCRAWGLVTPKATKMKTFFHKGTGKNIACEVVGYVDDITAVIKLTTGELHLIHPSYLKEMQAASYGTRVSLASGELAEVETTQDSEVNEEANVAAEATQVTGTPEETTASEDESLEPSTGSQQAKKPLEGIVDISFPPEEDLEQDSKPVLKETKVKKPKQPKLELPTEKVRMSAKVAEFTTVPNHFSESEDEVIIYEEVKVIEPELLIGEAWSSHSATLKKLELEVGDLLTFDAKVVAKKLTKHPVAYKINNPAKIQKNEES